MSPLESVPGWALLGLGLLMGASQGCGDDVGSSVAERLRQCGFLTEGEVRTLPFYAPTGCYRSCLADTSCDDLQLALCGDSSVLRGCDERCAFRCGSGELIAVEQQCDGVESCADASDEQGCLAGITCADGTVLPEAAVCNGYQQCPDGRDEQGCAVDCARTPDIPQCDPCLASPMLPECADRLCDDGNVYPRSVRCDGWNYCSDGRDEEGCATLDAMCPMP